MTLQLFNKVQSHPEVLEGRQAQGKLIVFEGIDGCGKETQAGLLKNKFKKEGRSVKIIDFPRYGISFYGKFLGELLSGKYGDYKNTIPHLSALPHTLDRVSAKNKIEKWLKEGRTVISNRYTSSNAAFQSAKLPEEKQDEFVKWIYNLEYKIHKIPKEDLTIYLKVPTEITFNLVDKKKARNYLSGSKKDLHEKDFDFQKLVKLRYDELAKQFNWTVIDCASYKNEKILPREVIAEKIWQKIKNFISY